MSDDADRYTLIITSTARRQLAQHLAEAVAFAAHEFVVGALLDNPQRLGKRLHAPLDDRYSARRGTYRVIYRVDEEKRTVMVVDIAHRRGAYRQPLTMSAASAPREPGGMRWSSPTPAPRKRFRL